METCDRPLSVLCLLSPAAREGLTTLAMKSCHIDKMMLSKPIRTFEMKRGVVGIRRAGEPGPTSSKDTPTVWTPSMATMAAVLSEDND